MDAPDLYALTDLNNVDEDAWRLRDDMAILLRERIDRRGWTQREAAEALNTNQPRISDLVNDRLGRASIDNTLRLLLRSGFRAEVVVDTMLETLTLTIQSPGDGDLF